MMKVNDSGNLTDVAREEEHYKQPQAFITHDLGDVDKFEMLRYVNGVIFYICWKNSVQIKDEMQSWELCRT